MKGFWEVTNECQAGGGMHEVFGLLTKSLDFVNVHGDITGRAVAVSSSGQSNIP